MAFTYLPSLGGEGRLNSILLPVLAGTAVLYLVARALFTSLHRSPATSKSGVSAPAPVSEDLPFIGALSFWTRRWTFFQHAISQSAHGNFSFFIGPHPIVGTSGDEGRKAFFESKQFGLTEGYGVLFGMFPSTRVENKEGEDTFITTAFAMHFKERITRMVRREVTERNLPTLISDTRARLGELARNPKGYTDPFDTIYKLVYLLTTRTVGAVDIALDRRLLDTTLSLYETVAQAATMAPIVLPWFPSINLLKRYVAGARLFFTLNRIVKKRKQPGAAKEQDPLQDMVDRGDQTSEIVGVMLGALFAAQQNSGINVSWVLLYLASNPEWCAKALAEVRAVAARYYPAEGSGEGMSLEQKVAGLPLEAWETEFPTLELCLKDCIRLHALGACFRKNISGREVGLGKSGECVPEGAFASYHISDLHLDPQVYRDPLQWDPSRYLPDRAEHLKKPNGWVGWGSGRHPCLGMKFAKLEQNIILALFLATFEEFNLCDSKGRRVDEPPPIDLESYSSWKPTEEERFIRFKVAGDYGD